MTGPKFNDLPAVNAYLGADGWCQYPVCLEPSHLCESLSAGSESRDDDYTDALAKWEAERNEWGQELQKEWEEDLAEWLAEDPEREEEDYPVPRPPARDPEDYPEPAPEKPEGYDDVDHSSYLPFVEPEGEPADSVTTLYRVYAYNDSVDGKYIGKTYEYLAYSYSEGTREYLAVGTWDGLDNLAESKSGNQHETATDECGPVEDTEGGQNAPWPPFGGTPTVVEELHFECLETTMREKALSEIKVGDFPLSLNGCPGPFPDDSKVAYDIEIKTDLVHTLSSGVTRNSLCARAAGKILTTWPDEPVGSSCVAASVITQWPTIGGSIWSECGDSALPRFSLGIAYAEKVRYKTGVPTEWLNWQDRKDAYDAWVAEGSDPDHPVSAPGTKRTKYYARWQEVLFPHVWEDWKAKKDLFDAKTKEHEEWEALDPDDRGPEPVIPADPGAPPDAVPELVETRSWSWDGTQENQYSEFFAMAAPSIEGETRRVNMEAKACDTRYGMKYTRFGERYEGTL